MDKPKANISKLPVSFLVPHIKHKQTAKDFARYVRDVNNPEVRGQHEPTEKKKKATWRNQSNAEV